MKNNKIEIYVDGSYNTKTGHAGWGIVIIKNKKIIYEDYGKTFLLAHSRQIDGELKGARIALKWIKRNKIPATIYCDFIGIQKWFNGDWEAKTDIAKKYVEFCNNIKKDICVSFVHVKGHSGNKWNDYVDKLAEKGKGE
jgi:ribonuclease HI